MGEIDSTWIDKFSILGWRPNNRINSSLDDNTESIWGAINTGDNLGEIIGINFSTIKNQKRIETTLLGFTFGSENTIAERQIIQPSKRISGKLLIAQNRFIIIGNEVITIPFEKIFSTSGYRNSARAANYDLQRLGEHEYNYNNEIYISKIMVNRQIVLETGYDEYSIAIVIGNREPNLIENTWRQIERQVAL
jgi:hypothetical protein